MPSVLDPARACSRSIHLSGKELFPQRLPLLAIKEGVASWPEQWGRDVPLWHAGVWGHLTRMPFPFREHRECGEGGRKGLQGPSWKQQHL